MRSLPAIWFRPEDYDGIRFIVDDPDSFPDSFTEWLDIAERQVGYLMLRGVAVRKVIVDPNRFVAFCSQARIKRDASARARYVGMLLRNSGPRNGADAPRRRPRANGEGTQARLSGAR